MLTFTRLYEVLLGSGRSLKTNAFKDPLEHDEWQGLLWSLKMFGYGERPTVLPGSVSNQRETIPEWRPAENCA